MYASAFWALKQITGDYHESILAEMSPQWRSVGEKAMKAVKGE
jgi:hypothetical protein